MLWLDRLLAILEKLSSYVGSFAIGYGLADKKRRDLEAEIDEYRLKEKLRINAEQIEKEFSGLSDSELIDRAIERSKRSH